MNVNLSANQVRAIRALLECPRISDAAKYANVTERTVYRWMGDPIFSTALRAAETAALSDAIRSLIADQKTNHGVMQAIRDNPRNSAAVRLRAAVALDGSLLKWRSFQDFEERVTALEGVVYGKE